MYKWTYSWKEILRFYKRKQEIYVERTKINFDFLADLATACMGGSSGKEGEVSLDSGEGMDDISEEEEARLRSMLGEDYDRLYTSG